MLALAARGWPLRGLVSDTALAAYLARPDQRSYDLADLTLRYLKRELKQERRPMTGQLTFDALDDSVSSDATDTAMLHARAVVDLADALDNEIEERGGSRLLAEVELPLIDLLALMEQTGIAVDIDHLQSLEAEFAGGVKLAAEAAYSAIGKEINLGSPKQLQGVLFDELGMPKTKRTKTGYTTDADALVGLLAKVEEGTKAGRLPEQPAPPPRRRAAAADDRGAAQDRGRRRPHPHDVQPADRGHRPAVLDRAQPPEHPDPHRGGPPHPRGLHRRATATSR